MSRRQDYLAMRNHARRRQPLGDEMGERWIEQRARNKQAKKRRVKQSRRRRRHPHHRDKNFFSKAQGRVAHDECLRLDAEYLEIIGR